MNFSEYINISKLIARSLIKNLVVEERNELDNWLKEDPSHKQLIENIVNQENWERRDENIKLLDKILIWENINNQIRMVKEKPIFPIKKAIQYAAAIIIPLAMIYGGWYLYKEIPIKQNNQMAQIRPGKSKARLTLGNGQVVELGKNDTILSTKDENIKIEIDTGKVEYKKDGLPRLKKEIHKIEVPRGGEMFLTLSDGTKVWLNSETELKFPAVFTEKERRVYLKGEALFDVAKDATHPFIVIASGINVTALGTKFNISAYPDDEFLHATLVEGKVVVNEEISGKSQSVILEPSQQAYINKSNTQELIIQKVNTDIYTSWAEGRFIFKNESLELILNKLSRWYNVDVFYDDFEVIHSKFSGKMPRFENCETILKLMEKTNSVKFETTEKTILVKSAK
ncbi:MAG: hypothetical protein CVU00_09780 [Bacteroidetes bacterium HGW-Bacteroidetes-17]|jgi:hypothetical protein|nr:MAG: hypothetical protein CVU00_09780 [Bacteroidetes bacterium HGW-Bacteroidetes-17]